MLREFYLRGYRAALAASGSEKNAGVLSKVLTNPAMIGGVMGAGGNLIAGGDTPAWERALRGGTAGAAIGAGVRYGPRLLGKIPGMTAKGGALAPGVADLSWMIPSLLAAPVIMGSGDTSIGGKTRVHFRGKR